MKHIILLTILFFGCTAKEKTQNSMINSEGTESINQFWNWFVANKETFDPITENDHEADIDLILTHLREVEPGLVVEISREVNDTREIVISADGDRNKFDAVKKIVSQAPVIEHWKVTAFRQRVPGDFTMEMNGLRLTPSKMYFHPLVEGDSLDVLIFIENISGRDYNQVAYAGLITLDNVLGEYDCVMNVRHYEFADLSEAENKTELRPLTALADYVDDFHRKKAAK